MRLAVLSNAALDPWVNWSTLGPPFLQPLAEHPCTTLLRPPPLKWSNRSAWAHTIGQVRKADTLFWMQSSSHPELPLWTASAFKPSARRAAFVVDAWQPLLNRIGTLAVAQRLNPCFVAFREARDELQKRYPRGRFEWLTFGVDTDVFRPQAGDRDIFAYWMGRRSPKLHEALLHYCSERGLTYRYTQRSGEFADPSELGRLVARSRYFVVTPPDDTEKTGGFSPLVMRYLEGLAAGARLLGVVPKSGEFEALLPRQAICEVASDGADLAERLDADANNADGWAAVSAASLAVHREHSWRRRAEQVYDVLTAG